MPSDYESADGQMAASLNLIHEEGAMRPVFQPKRQIKFQMGDTHVATVKYIHKTADYTHYIVQVNDNQAEQSIGWIDSSVIELATELPVVITPSSEELNFINVGGVFRGIEMYEYNAIGNTLVVLTENGMHYILWKDDTYTYLGTHLPELELSFGLQGTKENSEDFYVEIKSTAPTQFTIGELPYIGNEKLFSELHLSDDKVNEITDTILAQVNKYIADNSTNAGKFLFPFFVRYAYRLYDGSLTMHSSPVLMTTSSKMSPHAFITNIATILDDNRFYVQGLTTKIGGLVFDLDYQCVGGLNALQDWSDIVSSVDIFVSAPIYTYDQSGKVTGIMNYEENKKGFTIANIPSEGNDYYDIRNDTSLSISNYGGSATTIPGYEKFYKIGKIEFIVPQHDEETLKTDVLDRAAFYKLTSLELSEISTNTRELIHIQEDYLQSLVNRELMTDDYDSHDILVSQVSYIYNSRLNIGNIKKKLATPARLITCSPFTNTNTENYYMHVFISDNGKEYVMTSAVSVLGGFGHSTINYLYYPNPHAHKIVIESRTDNLYAEFPLKMHAFLNGAVYHEGMDNTGVSTVAPPEDTTDNTYRIPNKIYSSEVNNPFFFPVTGINTVGTGTILAMSAATKALSQGQFGQFPLYVFSDDGVWALEVSPTGTFSSSHPVTRDVCINADSITQIDTAVLFATERGIMLVQGSDTVCISDALFSEHPFNVLDLPHASVLHTMLGHNTDTCLPTKPFIGFLSGCQMLYDYVHQHIIVFNPSKTVSEGVTTYDYTYAYVYSRKSKEWGMMYTNVRTRVNSYPEAMAMTHDGHFVSFARAAADNDYKGLFITRPIKLGNPDVLKSIHTVIQRGMCQRGDVNTVLWGSRDLYNWYLIGSSTDNAIRNLRGTPYKYFRIGGVATLTDGKSLFGVSVEAEPRHTSVMQ